MISKYQLQCSCVVCKQSMSVQNLGRHCTPAPPIIKKCPKCVVAHFAGGKYCSPGCANSRTFSLAAREKKRASALANVQARPSYTPVGWCPICNNHQRHSKCCSKACISTMLSRLMKQRIYDGFNPNRNRGRGKQSYMEYSFQAWIDQHYPILMYHTEHQFKRLDIVKSYFVDFFFPTKT